MKIKSILKNRSGIILDNINPVEQIKLLKKELDTFKDNLTQKVSWVVCNKIDLIDQGKIDAIRKQIQTSMNISSSDIYFISAATGKGTKSLLKLLETEVIEYRKKLA